MKKEVGKLYETYCDECGGGVGGRHRGGTCPICKRDVCGNHGRDYWITWGDDYLEPPLFLCNKCAGEHDGVAGEFLGEYDQLQKLRMEQHVVMRRLEKIRDKILGSTTPP